MNKRRLGTEAEVVEEFGFDLATFRSLVARGRLPKPIPELGLYDMKAVDLALDQISGIGSSTNELDAWRRKRAG